MLRRRLWRRHAGTPASSTARSDRLESSASLPVTTSASPTAPTHAELRVVWSSPAARPPVVATSYDGWMHHRMVPCENGQDGYAVTLPVPKGVLVSYKFLVDGVWRVDATGLSEHPVARDGKVHTAVFYESPPQNRLDTILSSETASKHLVTEATEKENQTKPILSCRGKPVAHESHALSSHVDSFFDDLVNIQEDVDKIIKDRMGVTATCGTAPSSFTGELRSEGRDDAQRSGGAQFARGSHAQASRPDSDVCARKSIRMHMTGGKWRAHLTNSSVGKASLKESFSSATPSTDEPSNNAVQDPPNRLNCGGRATPQRDMNPSFSAPQIRYSATYRRAVPDTADVNDENVRTLNTALGSVHSTKATNVQHDAQRSAEGATRSDSIARHGAPLGGERRNSRRPLFFANNERQEFRLFRSLDHNESQIDKPSRTAEGREDFITLAEDSKQVTPSATLPNTPTRSRRAANRGTLRSSTRNMARVVVSGPTRVDQPVDVNDVHRTAQNWRDMARHLQDDLKDPVGARQLLENAVEHREKHGLLSTLENAQAHIDLARSLGKTENFSDAESHLRTALQIYEQIEAAPDHIADLVHYIAVVTDRQRKRREAEMLYRKALDIYKVNNVSGSNVDIAVKNLDLNLRKQRVSSN
jgi:hypothetical protein